MPADPVRDIPGLAGAWGWIKRFTQAALPGPFLRVIEPGKSAPPTRSRSCTGPATT